MRLAACFLACSIGVGITLVDVGATQQIVESADPVPSVPITFQDNAVFAGFVSATVVLSKKINQQLALCAYSRPDPRRISRGCS